MSDIDLVRSGLAVLVFLMFCVPFALLGALVSWGLARRVSAHAALRVWTGIWATLLEVGVVAVGWLQYEWSAVALVVFVASIVVAVQCARTEWRHVKGDSRETRWCLAPHLLAGVSIVFLVAMGWVADAPLGIVTAVTFGLMAAWGTWPLRVVQKLEI